MIAVATVLMVLALSLVIVRIATVGLSMTGLSRDLAQFQALSAFTGSGFTTRESEDIVNHPIRRRIVMHLMLLGNAGMAIVITSFVASVLRSDRGDTWTTSLWTRLLILAGGSLLLLYLANSSWLERFHWRAGSWALQRWAHLEVKDYTNLLHLSRNYRVCELRVHENDWLANHRLIDLQLANEGVLVLGIERRDGSYVGAPRGQTRVEPGDLLILYGRGDALNDLDERQAGMEGNMHHVIAVTRQQDIVDEEFPLDKHLRDVEKDESR